MEVMLIILPFFFLNIFLIAYLHIKNVDVKQIGVRGRNSDNKLIREKLGWEPNLPLEKGMTITYDWINKQVNN